MARLLPNSLQEKVPPFAVADINDDGANDKVRAIEANGGKATTHHLDVADADSCRRVVNEILSLHNQFVPHLRRGPLQRHYLNMVKNLAPFNQLIAPPMAPLGQALGRSLVGL